MEVKENEQRNNVALQQLAEMVDSVIGMGPIISQHLCEKGLSMPHATGSSRITSHRSESEYSLRHGSSSKGQCETSFVECGFLKLFLVFVVSQRSLFTSGSSSNSTKNNESAKSTGPTIITLDFPDNNKKSHSDQKVDRSRRK